MHIYSTLDLRRNRIIQFCNRPVINAIPFLLKCSPQFIPIPRQTGTSTNLAIKVLPYVLNDVKIRAGRGLGENRDGFGFEPIFDNLGSMFRIVVVLENNLLW